MHLKTVMMLTDLGGPDIRYEAFVIYVFVSLCFEYLGGEAAILSALHGRENVPMWFTCTCCLAPFPYDLQFLRFIKQGVLQFCVVKPFMALITIACVATDNYEDGVRVAPVVPCCA